MNPRLALSVAVALAATTPLFTGANVARDIDDSQPSARPRRWYKGNTHTHTLESDGDSTPQEVARWYRERGSTVILGGLHVLSCRDECAPHASSSPS